jgi:hypothetical protein
MYKVFKQLILHLIALIEFFEYINTDTSEKVLFTQEIDNLEIETDTGFSKLSHFHVTKPFTVHRIETSGGKWLECADTHIVFEPTMKEVFVKDLQQGSLIQTVDGIETITHIEIFKQTVSMADVTVDDENHRFYSNGILSHNSVISGIFIAWYLTFHYDRNALVVANKLQTTNEIVSKIKHVLQNLPFFLKTGIRSMGVTGISLDNGCRLISSATTPTAGIGFTNHLVYADEFAYVHDNIADRFFKSIFPTLASSKISRMILTSTPNGKNLFYRIYKGALEKTNAFFHLRTDWWEVEGRDEAWKRQEIANLGSEEIFNQEYGNSFDSSTRLLANSNVIKFFDRIKKQYQHQFIEELESDYYDYKHLKWHPELFKKLNDDDKFVVTIDLGSGVGGDNSVINIFKVQRFNYPKIFKYLNISKGEDDFFSLIQVGMFKDNYTDNAELAFLTADLIMDFLLPENTLLVLEINHRGEEFKKDMENFRPDIFDYDIFFRGIPKTVKGKIIMTPGVRVGKDRINDCKNLSKDWINKRIVATEQDTCMEVCGFGLNENSTKYEGLGVHDDTVMTMVNLTKVFGTSQFNELIEKEFDLFTQAEYELIQDKIITSN